MGAHAWQVDHVSDLSEEQEDEIAVLAELLRDYGDLWSDIGPTGQRDALKTIYEGIDVLRVLVSKAAEPRMAVLREKNCPLRFAW
jgi:hypothetical protein